MKHIQKLTRNGNATAVTIPRAVLHYLGLTCGEWLIVEVLEDRSIRLRRPEENDFRRPTPGELFAGAVDGCVR